MNTPCDLLIIERFREDNRQVIKYTYFFDKVGAHSYYFIEKIALSFFNFYLDIHFDGIFEIAICYSNDEFVILSSPIEKRFFVLKSLLAAECFYFTEEFAYVKFRIIHNKPYNAVRCPIANNALSKIQARAVKVIDY